MKRLTLLALVAASVVATPLLAAPSLAGAAAKKPLCQMSKAARDLRRAEPCRKPPIPPVIDPTPMFLVSIGGSLRAPSGLA